jgi:5-methylcytosine-specific restriction protein A
MVPQSIWDWLQGKPTTDAGRSPQWANDRKKYLLTHPFCAICGQNKSIELHHVLPFHIFPKLEREPLNWIPLGEGCTTGNHHLLFGHLGNYKDFNPNILLDAAIWAQRIKSRDDIGAILGMEQLAEMFKAGTDPMDILKELHKRAA